MNFSCSSEKVDDNLKDIPVQNYDELLNDCTPENPDSFPNEQNEAPEFSLNSLKKSEFITPMDPPERDKNPSKKYIFSEDPEQEIFMLRECLRNKEHKKKDCVQFQHREILKDFVKKHNLSQFVPDSYIEKYLRFYSKEPTQYYPNYQEYLHSIEEEDQHRDTPSNAKKEQQDINKSQCQASFSYSLSITFKEDGTHTINISSENCTTQNTNYVYSILKKIME